VKIIEIRNGDEDDLIFVNIDHIVCWCASGAGTKIKLSTGVDLRANENCHDVTTKISYRRW